MQLTEETAKALADAANRLAAALEHLTAPGAAIGGGIHIHHHGIPQSPWPYTAPYSPWWSPTICGPTMISEDQRRHGW